MLQMLFDCKVMIFVVVGGDVDVEGIFEMELVVEVDLFVLLQFGDELVDFVMLVVYYIDLCLQIWFKFEYLQKCLLEMYYEYCIMFEEQGVNVLYFVLG